MTQEEIIEGNKLIAEFMGWWFDIGDKRKYIRILDEKNFEYLKSENDLLFNSSWDWLMSAVEKIESIIDKHHGYFGVYISSNNCSIQGTNFRSDKIVNPPIYLCESYGDTKLEATYIMCIKFIKWYNENKK